MRIALLSDTAGTRELLRRAARIGSDELCGSFSETAAALESFREDPPDLLVLEIGSIPGGARLAMREIEGRLSRPVLLLARAGSRSLGEVARALDAGAIDVVLLPGATESARCVELLARKLRTMRRLMRHGAGTASETSPRLREARSGFPPLVAIGASTGGPKALAVVLSDLPKPFVGVVLAALHIERAFAAAFLTWLGQASGIPCRMAQAGERPTPGSVCIAAPDQHLILTGRGSLDYAAEPADALFRPSIDVLFRSLAEHATRPGVAVLLTGMGRDGAEGMKMLRARGWLTITQDEASSAVYGMPRAAVEIGASSRVLALDRIGHAVGCAARLLSESGSPLDGGRPEPH